MYYENRCTECAHFRPVIVGSGGKTQTLGTLTLQSGEGKNVYFPWKEGKWNGKARSVNRCKSTSKRSSTSTVVRSSERATNRNSDEVAIPQFGDSVDLNSLSGNASGGHVGRGGSRVATPAQKRTPKIGNQCFIPNSGNPSVKCWLQEALYVNEPCTCGEGTTGPVLHGKTILVGPSGNRVF